MNLEQYNDFFLNLPIQANGGRCYEPNKFNSIGVSKIPKPNGTLEYGDDDNYKSSAYYTVNHEVNKIQNKLYQQKTIIVNKFWYNLKLNGYDRENFDLANNITARIYMATLKIVKSSIKNIDNRAIYFEVHTELVSYHNCVPELETLEAIC